jgi:hypothetical protein
MMELHSDLRRQQGRWNNTAMDKCYSDLPLPAIRSLAGFSGPGSFFLPRGTVKPPEELVELLYPAPLDTWIRKKDDGAIHDGLTTEQFIKVLKFLRVVFLQDAAIMIDRRPKDIIWKHQIFQMDSFLRFKKKSWRLSPTCHDLKNWSSVT